jgi:hypothetical protein
MGGDRNMQHGTADGTVNVRAPCSPQRLLLPQNKQIFFFYGETARYRALASLIKPLHSSLSCAALFQFLTPISFFASSSTASIHLFLGFKHVSCKWHLLIYKHQLRQEDKSLTACHKSQR